MDIVETVNTAMSMVQVKDFLGLIIPSLSILICVVIRIRSAKEYITLLS